MHETSKTTIIGLASTIVGMAVGLSLHLALASSVVWTMTQSSPVTLGAVIWVVFSTVVGCLILMAWDKATESASTNVARRLMGGFKQALLMPLAVGILLSLLVLMLFKMVERQTVAATAHDIFDNPIMARGRMV
jgi:uncharacterized membrane protein